MIEIRLFARTKAMRERRAWRVCRAKNKRNESNGGDEITTLCDATYLVKHEQGMRAVTIESYNLFNAFFLFAPAVSFAVLFTALVAVFVAAFPAIFASAVPNGGG